MKFKAIEIRNFRNFDDISIYLSNKNVLFGLNDVGKSNFLYALRYVFDRDVRKQNFIDSDFYKKGVDKAIEIIVSIDISEENDTDNEKLRARLKGAMRSGQDTVYIKLRAEYDKKEMIGIPVLYWGGDKDDLEEMRCYGSTYDIDYVFNVIYIDAYVDLYALFKRKVNALIVNDKEQDKKTIDDINNIFKELNDKISTLSGIQALEKKLAPEYQKFRHGDVSVSIKSEIAVKGLFSGIVPYIKQDQDDMLYPASGEGRKKLLVYSIFDLLSKDQEERKINLFLIEEPENHLHRSMQISLSHILFGEQKYQYLFLTTHSPYVLIEMDHVNLLRIYNQDKVTSKSVLYEVPNDFISQRKMLNVGLVEAIFADKVLLVEGPSEKILFEKVLSVIDPLFETSGAYILSVNGFGFSPYLRILSKLGIKTIIKTDNDLRRSKDGKYSVLGFMRINRLIGKTELPEVPILTGGCDAKRNLYLSNAAALDQIRKDKLIFLSKCSLEEDLDEVIHDEMREYLDGTNPVSHLQQAKWNNMVKLSEKLSEGDCKKIYNHYNFACLKEVSS